MPALLKVASAVRWYALIMKTTEGAHNQFFPIPMLHNITANTIQCHNRAVNVTVSLICRYRIHCERTIPVPKSTDNFNMCTGMPVWTSLV